VMMFAKWQRGIRRWWVSIALQVVDVGIPASWAIRGGGIRRWWVAVGGGLLALVLGWTSESYVGGVGARQWACWATRVGITVMLGCGLLTSGWRWASESGVGGVGCRQRTS